LPKNSLAYAVRMRMNSHAAELKPAEECIGE
jgi:hypothetical protein